MIRVYKILICFATLLMSVVSFSKSRVEKCSMHSDILDAEKEYVVYLPDGYDENVDVVYPVLYLLHGLGGNCDTWAEKYDLKSIADRRIKSGFSLPMIIVMPDASGVLDNYMGRNVGYVNRSGWMYEDYFFKELVPEVERKFRVVPDSRQRAVSGLSMGGAASVIYAMHHPEFFCCACPMSARVEGSPDKIPGSGGDREEFYAYSRENNMVEYLKAQSPERQEAIAKVRWYIDCGDSDGLLSGNMHLYELMCSLKFEHTNFRVREGSHKADYWRTSLPEVMTFVSIGFIK